MGYESFEATLSQLIDLFNLAHQLFPPSFLMIFCLLTSDCDSAQDAGV